MVTADGVAKIVVFGLAKLCEQTGKAERAKAEYGRFLETWKNADPDQPELIDARRRLAVLNKSK